ncbi:MAG: flagellar basal body P-ring protein FlgI [Fimbriimonadaceae bacterium]|nr:flagellar basal body P-ring protein FlgI [Fimbriimonadaceae bacterium]
MKFIPLSIIVSFALASATFAQTTPPPTQADPPLTEGQQRAIQQQMNEQAAQQRQARRLAIQEVASEGLPVRLGDIGGFRGARSNKIIGYGLVVGLQGTGDSRSTPFTATLMANALARWGTQVNEQQYRAKNIAVVSVTAELPAFAAPGRKMDVTVSSLGDAGSLQGGFLLPTTLAALTNPDDVYAVASGAVSIGGYNVGSGGSSQRTNHANVAVIQNGADVERSVATQILFAGNVMFFDLDEPDFTTVERAVSVINNEFVDIHAVADDGVTIRLIIPEGVPATYAAKEIEGLIVKANLPASVVINERTGTIVIGGDVKLGPAVIAHGSLKVRIDTDFAISQPLPFSDGQTVVVAVPTTQVQEGDAQIAVVAPNATVEDLAQILQTLKVSARDIIAILQALADQGALKARVIQR